MFAIVCFLGDGSVKVVPSNWLGGDECISPERFIASRTSKAVKHQGAPDLTYKRNGVVVLSLESKEASMYFPISSMSDISDAEFPSGFYNMLGIVKDLVCDIFACL